MDFAGLGQMSLFGRLGLLIGTLPLLVGVWCAARPSERGLSLMRPLSLAALFAVLEAATDSFSFWKFASIDAKLLRTC